MSFLAVLLALLLEQARPLSRDNPVHNGIRRWVAWIRQSLDAGRGSHGVLVWLVAVGAPAIFAVVVHWLLWSYSLILTFAWAVLVLYLTLGFRHFSHHFTHIRSAVEEGKDAEAAAALAAWRQVPTPDHLTSGGFLGLLMTHAIQSVHRHVLGVLVAFVVTWWLGLGPAGAVLYRLADHMARACRRDSQWPALLDGAAAQPEDARTGEIAAKAWHWIDWLPSRGTGVAFAIVGNFEEAVAAWRARQAQPNMDNPAVVLAAASGALNLQLDNDRLPDGADLRTPETAHLASLVGLVWRSVVLWMLLLALLTLANVLG
jgi:adenosylcobinamide-phosphate synthase